MYSIISDPLLRIFFSSMRSRCLKDNTLDTVFDQTHIAARNWRYLLCWEGSKAYTLYCWCAMLVVSELLFLFIEKSSFFWGEKNIVRVSLLILLKKMSLSLMSTHWLWHTHWLWSINQGSTKGLLSTCNFHWM